MTGTTGGGKGYDANTFDSDFTPSGNLIMCLTRSWTYANRLSWQRVAGNPTAEFTLETKRLTNVKTGEIYVCIII